MKLYICKNTPCSRQGRESWHYVRKHISPHSTFQCIHSHGLHCLLQSLTVTHCKPRTQNTHIGLLHQPTLTMCYYTSQVLIMLSLLKGACHCCEASARGEYEAFVATFMCHVSMNMFVRTTWNGFAHVHALSLVCRLCSSCEVHHILYMHTLRGVGFLSLILCWKLSYIYVYWNCRWISGWSETSSIMFPTKVKCRHILQCK